MQKGGDGMMGYALGAFGIILGIVLLVIAFTVAPTIPDQQVATAFGVIFMFCGIVAVVITHYNKPVEYTEAYRALRSDAPLNNKFALPSGLTNDMSRVSVATTNPFAQQQMPNNNTGMQTNPETTFILPNNMLQSPQTINQPSVSSFAPSVSQPFAQSTQ